MAYKCPNCGGTVQRGSSDTARIGAGAVGALLYSAFGDFQCVACGPIRKGEFPLDVQKKIFRGSVLLVISGLAIIAFVIWAVLASQGGPA